MPWGCEQPPDASAADRRAASAAFDKALHAWQERQRCALRAPRTPRRPWQHGHSDLGALPLCAIERIWRLLDTRARVACLGVCRAWRVGFAPPDAFSSITCPADADGQYLQRLAPLCDGVHSFMAAGCTELEQEDVSAFLWSSASKQRLRAQLPVFDEPCTLDELASLTRLSGHCSIEADVTAADGARLLALLGRGGVVPRRLTLQAAPGGEPWQLDTLLRCLAVCCARATPPARERYERGPAPPFAAPPLELCLLGVRTEWAPDRDGYDTPRREDSARFRPLDAALAQLARAHLVQFEAFNCRLTRRWVPALCGLLRGGLALLELSHHPRLLKRSKRRRGPPPVAQLAAAIREAPQLAELRLWDLQFATQADVVTLLQACTGHPTLRSLELSLASQDGGHDDAASGALVGAALGALVAAGSPALHTLQLIEANSAAQLAPLADALRRGGHAIYHAWCDGDGRDALQAAAAAGHAATKAMKQ
jgi:hypothetical protein